MESLSNKVKESLLVGTGNICMRVGGQKISKKVKERQTIMRIIALNNIKEVSKKMKNMVLGSIEEINQ